MAFEVDLREYNKFIAKLKRAAKFQKNVRDSMGTASKMIVDYSKKNHIFVSRSGNLERSVFHKESGNAKPQSYIFAEADYSGWIWYGKRKTTLGNTAMWNNGKGDPFILNAYDSQIDEYIEILNKELTKDIQGDL